MKFYSEHEDDRDRFEIVGVCLAYDGKPATLTELDARMKPFIDNLWDEKSIPYPVVLDATFKTWERYGIPGLGTSVLVDPQGRLVEGDVNTLAEILKKK